jgi:FKBP-type peptidyl-prolyl cis-trans isomerase FkpA
MRYPLTMQQLTICLNYRLIISLLLLSIPLLVGCQKPQTKQKNITPEDLIEANRNLVGRDVNAIKAYLKERNLSFTETQTGLWVSITQPGKGKKAEKGQVITLQYTITLLDGTVCYSSEKNGNKVFRIGQGGVESGLEEAVLLLKKGAKAQFILPPHLAHGLVGDDDKIPARATLIYDVHVIDLK